METSVNLPFYAKDIPAPLPTSTEIEDAEDISLAYGGRRVVKVGQHFVVKFGKGIDLVEGENMLFVQHMTNIPVPHVYALYSDSQTGKQYIIMEHVTGVTLTSMWPNLTPAEKESITTTLRYCYDELRQLQSPGYFGSLGRRRLLDEMFWTRDIESMINGPFDTEDALNEAMAQKYTYDGRPPYKAEFYRQCLPRVFCGHEPTFTHGDCQRKNIMVRADTHSKSSGGHTFDVVILDWEKSGWYPAYWEYCLAVCALRWDDDWGLWIQKILEPYVPEASWLQMLRLELWS
jgi:hypothetical protein